jgi:predicted lipoprotein with Yx(FWY)xxD motif
MRSLLCAGAAGICLLAAACGGSGSSEGTAQSTAPNPPAQPGPYGGGAPASSAAPTPAAAATVDLQTVGKLGKVLVDSRGITLYLFMKDKGTASTCTGSCAAAWPPLLTQGAPKAGPGARPNLLGTTKRDDGTTQVTYGGHPLYTFVSDHGPGMASGQDVSAFGAPWYVVGANGKKIGD